MEFVFTVGGGYEILIIPKNAVDFTWIFKVISNLNHIGVRVALGYGT